MTHPSAIAELLVYTVPQIVRLLYFFSIHQSKSVDSSELRYMIHDVVIVIFFSERKTFVLRRVFDA